MVQFLIKSQLNRRVVLFIHQRHMLILVPGYKKYKQNSKMNDSNDQLLHQKQYIFTVKTVHLHMQIRGSSNDDCHEDSNLKNEILKSKS